MSIHFKCLESHVTCEALAVHGHRFGMIYMASPLTHELAGVQKQRYQEAVRHASWLIRKGVNVFSPVAYTGGLDLGDLPTEFSQWQTMCLEQVEACSMLAVLKLPGWMESTGITAEISLARAKRKWIWFLEPMKAESVAA